MRSKLIAALLALLAPLTYGLGTSFTYQGRLSDGGSPPSGVYDLEFKLFDSPSGPTQVGALEVGDVNVSGGLFTVTLDFGGLAFDGNDRWLEIGVRPGASPGTYTTLTPRQQLTPAPNALFSARSGDAATIGGIACANNQIPKWNGTIWTCSVVTSDMLATGAVTSSAIASGAVGSAQIDAAQVQARVSSACPAGTTVQTVNSDGTVVCAADSVAQAGFAITTLDSEGHVGPYTSITIGADGLGLISYRDDTNNQLKVAHCSNPACSSATTTTLDGSVFADTSIAIGTDGLGLISYYGGGLKVAHCSNTLCSSATTATVDIGGHVGEYSSITIGADGLGLISYYDSNQAALKVAHCSNVACSSATTAILDNTAGVVGRYTSITIGADGLGLISYHDFTNDGLKVAHCSNTTCSSAANATLDSGNSVGSFTSITIGADGLGLISYYADGDLKVAHCSNTTCSSATKAVLDTLVSGGSSSITIGADGLGLISYHDNGNLGVAHCSNAACSSATTARVDTGGAVGPYSSITIGPDSLGLISYYDSDPNRDLKVAHCSNAQCIPFVDRRPVPLVGVTSVTAGSGLTGGTLTSAGTLAVAFAGSGSAATVARSDHGHTLGGDVTGATTATTVARLRGVNVSTTAPTANQALRYNSGISQWEPAAVVTSVGSGNGLTGGPITTTGSLSVNFGGSGAATTVSRSDHDHFGQTWSGSLETALHLSGSYTGGSWFNVGNSSAGGKQWNLISTGSGNGEGAGKLLFRSNNDNTVVMTLEGNGDVGIGTTSPGFQLEITGVAAKPGGGSWASSSDARLKKNVQPLAGALDKLLRLRGVTYQWIDPASQAGLDGSYMGLIAQEVETVFPEWVITHPNGFKLLTVSGFEGLTAEALRELRSESAAKIGAQQAENDEQRKRIEALERHLLGKTTELDALRARLDRLEALLAGHSSQH